MFWPSCPSKERSHHADRVLRTGVAKALSVVRKRDSVCFKTSRKSQLDAPVSDLKGVGSQMSDQLAAA